MKSIRYIMYFVLMSMTMSLLAQENAQAVAQGENKIDEKAERNTKSYKHRPILYEQHTLGIILETYRSKKKIMLKV